MTAYVDLDGVLVDFVAGALTLHSKSLPPGDVRWDFCSQIGFKGPHDPAFWRDMGQSFWANLDWTADGEELLGNIEDIFGTENIVLLSSPCQTAGCAEGKREWVRRNLPAYERQLFLGQDKHLLAGPNKVLIDDYDHNINLFIGAGGYAVLVPRPWNERKAWTDEKGRFLIAPVVGEIYRTTRGCMRKDARRD